MARYKNGVLGQFTGTVGTVVGSQWNGISYMRSRSGKKSGGSSPLQLEQQAKFKTMVQFLMPIKDLLMSSCYTANERKTGYNIALGYNIKRAIAGTYPNFTIDYALVKLSLGWVATLLAAKATANSNGTITVSWQSVATQTNANTADEVVLMVYCPSVQEFIYQPASGTRGSGQASIDAAVLKQHVVHVYAACVDTNGHFSDSVYLGMLTL